MRGLFWIRLFALACFALKAGIALAAYQQPNTMEARLQACAACHGAKGEGIDNPYFPRLAAKPAGYLYNQLVAFKNGQRHYPPMTYLLEYLPEGYLQAMAEYFAAQRPPFPPPAIPDVSSDMLAHGELLVKLHVVVLPADLVCSGSARRISARSSALGAMAPARPRSPTVCKSWRPISPKTT